MQAAAPSEAASSDRVSRAVWAFSRRHWRYVVIGMLALLHVVALRGVADEGARVLVIAHLGLLLLWQPLLRGERALTATQAAVIALGAAAAALWLNWWLLAVWTVMLAGLVGGQLRDQAAVAVEHADDVGAEHHLLGPNGMGQVAGHGVAVDVQGPAVRAGGDRCDHRRIALGEQHLERTKIEGLDVADQAELLVA